jgi:hypothetical protein
MSDCRRVRILLALRPEDCSESERRLVASHVACCVDCAARARAYEEQDRLLGHAVQIDASPPEWGALLARIERGRRGAMVKSRAVTVVRSAVALVAIVVLILGLNALFQHMRGPDSVLPAAIDPTRTPTQVLVPTLASTATRAPTETPVSTPTPAPTATPMATETPEPATRAADPAPVPPAISFGYGIEAQAFADPQGVTEAVQDLGLGWLKQEVRWAQIEPAKGTYDWAGLDAVVASCSEAGIQVLLSITEAPDWARGDKVGFGPPEDPQDLADFAGAIASRYQGQVQAYEIWSGQNLQRAWEGAPLSAEAYVGLLWGAYEAIKAADPDAIVVSGALTPTGVDDGEWAIDDLAYLQEMYDAGLKDACDAVGVHPSGYANPPDVYYRRGDFDPARVFDDHRSFFFRNTMEDSYKVMVRNSDGDKAVWATEFGWGTTDGLGTEPNPGYEYTADIDEQQQADYIVGAYAWAKEWGHAGAMFLSNLDAAPVLGAEDAAATFSIVYEDGSPRPAYAALKEMAK